MAKPRKKRPHPIAHYVELHRVNRATIYRWEKLGWPIDDVLECRKRQLEQKNSVAAQRTADEIVTNTALLTDEQLENPSTKAEAQFYELVLICRRTAFNNKKERDLYALKSDVIQRVRELRLAEWSDIRAVFERETPPLCEGLSAAEIQRINADALARIAKDYQSKAEKCAG